MYKINGIHSIHNSFTLQTKTSDTYSNSSESKDDSFGTIFQSELDKLNIDGGNTMENSSNFDYTSCEHFLQEDVTPWHGDIFDHPSYQLFCTKGGIKKELIYPEGQCKRCYERRHNESKGC